jgi:diguanylate cyclase (GGDEF)-like protein/PAS domain S-box-containing protein
MVAAGGCVTLVSLAAMYQAADWLSLVPLLGLAAVAELWTIRLMETGRDKLTFSFSVATVLCGVIALPASSPLVALASGLAHVALVRQRQLDKALFNITNRQVAAGLATCLYLVLRPSGREFGAWHLLAAATAALAYYIVNSGAVALVMKLYSRRPLLEVVRDAGWSAPINIFLGLTGAFLGGAHEQLGVLGTAMFSMPLVLMRFTLAFYSSRSRRTIQTLQELNNQLAEENDQRVAAEAALSESEEHLRSVLDNVAEGIMTMDERGVIQSLNAAAERVFGYTSAEVVGQHCGMLVASLGRHGIGPGFSRYLDEGRIAGFGAFESHGLRKHGASFPLEVTVSEMHLASERLFIVSARDITERKRAAEALEHQALHDQLTSLPNRTLLHDRLQQGILAASRERRSLALLVIDLDHFKDVNDTFGHQYGDLLLEQIGPRLRAVLRESDTVARLGGDEFAILLPEADRAAAVETAGRLLAAFTPSFVVDGRNLLVGASIGVAICPEHGEDAQTLLRRADVAMYVAKRDGGGQAMYDPEQDRYSPGRLTLVGDLREALEGDGLLLHFQPTLDLQTGAFAGAEALVRWQHPERGLLPPDEFIPVAEQNGLIRHLSHWVLDRALQQYREWRQAGLDLPVAVNLSMRDLHDRHLPDAVANLLTRWNVAPACLTLEITESTLMADPAQAMEVVARLSAMGIQMAIDDFGTGYSSLAYLKRLPVDKLKIDKSFVRHLATDAHDAAIVQSTVGLAHALGLSLVAEGVEDQASWDLLAQMGCDVAQGYFISRPIPADKLTVWLQTLPGSAQSAKAA